MSKGNLNGIVNCEHPLAPARPNFLVITTKDGKRHVIGDGDPLTQDELILVGGGLVEQKRPRLEFTDEEAKALAESEDRLERARAVIADLWDERDRLVAHTRSFQSALHANAVTDEERAAKDAAQAKHDAVVDQVGGVEERIREARDIEQEALVVRNTIQMRVTRAAQARAEPHAFPHVERDIDARLQSLEQRR